MTLESANAYNSWINFSAASNEMSIGYDKSTVGGFVFSNSDTIASNIRMVILSTGSVGIGTATPDSKLEIAGGGYNSSLKIKGSGSHTGIQFEDSSGNTDGYIYAIDGNVGFLDTGADWTIQCKNDDYIRFATNGNTEHMRITSGGSVGIGTDSPDTLLHMRGAAATLTLESTGNTDDPTIMLQRDNNTGLAARIQLDNSGGDVFFDNTYDNDNGDIYFRTKGTTKRVTIKGSGSVGIGTATPSTKFQVHSGDILITSGKQLISTNSYTQAPPAMLTTQGPSTGRQASALGHGE